MHHRTQAGPARHTVPYLRHPIIPLQDSIIDLTEFGMTQAILMAQKKTKNPQIIGNLTMGQQIT